MRLFSALAAAVLLAASAAAQNTAEAPPVVGPTPTGPTGGINGGLNPVVPNGGFDVPNGPNIGGGNGTVNLDGETVPMTARGQQTATAGTRTSGPTTMTIQTTRGGSRTVGARSEPRTRTQQLTEQEAQLEAAALKAAQKPLSQSQAQGQTQGASRENAAQSVNSTAQDFQKAQAQDAQTGGSSAADLVRKIFRERSAGAPIPEPGAAEEAARTTTPGPAGSSGSGGSAVLGKLETREDEIAHHLSVAQNAERVPHDAPGHYRAALKAADDGVKAGELAVETAKEIKSVIKEAARQAAPDALTKIVQAAKAAASVGQEGAGNDYDRALGTPGTIAAKAKVGSLDDWSKLMTETQGPPISDLARVKDRLAVVRKGSLPGSTERVESPEFAFVLRGGAIEAVVSGDKVPKIPPVEFPLRESSVPTLSRREPPESFRPGASILDDAEELRQQGVGRWPVGVFIVKTAAHKVWDFFAGRPAEIKLAAERQAELFSKLDADYAAGDVAAEAADYAALTGDRNPLLAVASAQKAGSKRALAHWRELTRDRAERKRPPRESATGSLEAVVLASFGDYLAAHRGEAAADAAALEAKDPGFSRFAPAGTLLSRGRLFSVARSGKILLATDSATRERFAFKVH